MNTSTANKEKKRAEQLLIRAKLEGLTTEEAELFWGGLLPSDLEAEVLKAAVAYWESVIRKELTSHKPLTSTQLQIINNKIVDIKAHLNRLDNSLSQEASALQFDINHPNSPGHNEALRLYFNNEDAIQDEQTNALSDYAERIRPLLFDKQKEVFDCDDDTILAICSRNAGKSYLIAAKMLFHCLKRSGTMCAYFASTFEDARNIIVPSLQELANDIGLILPRGFHPWKLPNGSTIQIKGLSTEEAGSKKRGQQWALCCLDEVGHMPNYADFISQVVRNNLLKYGKGSQLLMIGTPPDNPGTWMEKMWNADDGGVRKFYWTARENPFFIDKISEPGTDADDAFDNEKAKEAKRLGLSIDAPLLQREFDGKFVYDTDNRVFPTYVEFDPKQALPNWPISRVFIGVDFGFSAYNAIVGVAWSDVEGAGFVFSEAKFNKMTNLRPNETMIERLTSIHSETVEKAIRFVGIKNWKQIKTYADTSDKMVVDYIQKNSRIRSDPTLVPTCGFPNKNGVTTKIDKLNILLRTNKLMVPKNGLLTSDFTHARWKKGPDGFLTDEITQDDTGHADVAMALLYAMEEVLPL